MTPRTVFLAAAFALLAVLPPAASAQAPADTLGRIKAAKAINVAFAGDSMPFAFVGRDSQPAGYSVDLCNKVVAGIGRAVGEPNLKVNWKVGTTAERLAMVADGRADLECGNTTPTLGRMKAVDFSALVFVDTGGFIARRDANVARFGDLAGKKIAVIRGTTTEQRLDAVLRERLVNAEVVRVREAAEAVALLDAGGAQAFASDKLKLVGAASLSRDAAALMMLDENLSLEPYAFALPRNDSSFRLEVNRALSQVYAGGELEAIYGRWFGQLGKPPALLTALFLLNVTQE
ncbi:MAG TPA: amino acid ABC transporter substrate-binding protein [Casimicrobiaceae bacterium]|nr:amino acid ABC transporter substrate-binding protein [Casimicrobiaceae bacterium]